MTQKPDQAFVLAAGKGTRLRPYTDHCPKPLVEMGGRPIIDSVLDNLEAAGIETVTVNLHYMGDMLEQHLKKRKRPHIQFSHEKELLNTGGGIKRGFGLMKPEPFFVVSGDSLWINGPAGQALGRMRDVWDSGKMDILILLQPVENMVLTKGLGDYTISPDGRVVRSLDKTGTHMWTSVRLCHPRIFDDTPDAAYSFLENLDRAEAAGRLYGLVHDGRWYHITSPEDLDRVNESLDLQKRRA